MRTALADIGSVYGVQLASYLLPLATVPYLSRVLGPRVWGAVAVAQAFAMYGHLVVEYGFIYSATRDIAQAEHDSEIERIVAAVSGAKLLLCAAAVGLPVLGLAAPLLRQYSNLLWLAVTAELLKALLPNFFFYGVGQVSAASALEIIPRMAAAAGVFVLVRRPADAHWLFILQAIGALAGLTVAQSIIYRRYRFRWPEWQEITRVLRSGGHMFLFRSAHNMYVLGNAFVLGLFASAETVGYYAGAEKINSAAVSLLSPLSTALYPRSASLAKQSLAKAAGLIRSSLLAMTAAGMALFLVMWFAGPLIVRLILGPHFMPSIAAFRLLSLRAPLVAVTNVLGFQWLLALGLERPFQRATITALLLNLVLAMSLAPHFAQTGMAAAVAISQAAVVAGIALILKKRGLNPLSLAPHAECI